MKYNLRTFLGGIAVFLAMGGVCSCSDDDLTTTIFSTDPAQDYLDKSSFTFPLDTFLKKEFLEPYNVRFVYRLEDKGSDLEKNLTPASYDKSVDIAVLTKYLWYDVYKKHAGEEFMKLYSPRIIQIAGSKNYNPSQGTETLGDASSGVKINLYNANNADVSNIDMMNEYFFKTMHHEFAHILDQTYLHPVSFNLLSSGHYDAAGWNETPDSVSAGSGFTSSYASSAVREDWAETFANFITLDSIKWNQLLESASYDWEMVDCKDEREYAKLLSPGCDMDTIGYYHPSDNGKNKVYRRVCARNADGTVALDEKGNVQWLHTSGIDGRALIVSKVQMVREYLVQYYNISLDALREEVQHREFVTNPDGTFATDPTWGGMVNKLTSVTENGQTLIDSLRNEVYQYKAIQP